MIDTVLFDMDGTLLNSLEDLKASLNFAFEGKGLPTVTVEEVRTYAGYGAARLVDDASKHIYPTDSAEFGELLASFRSYYAGHQNDATAPYDGIIELLGALAARGMKMGVVSNKAFEDTEALRRKWFSDYLTVAVGLTPELPKKPAPDMVFKALDALGSEASTTLYVGDSEPDAQIAKNSGCTGVSVLWGFRERAVLEAQEPAYLIERPGELLNILDELDGVR